MNIDLALLLKVVHGGAKAWERLGDDGVRLGSFVNDGAVVYQWIADRMEVADFPSVSDLQGRFSGLSWPDAERYRYAELVDGVRTRRLGQVLSDGAAAVSTLLSAGRIQEAQAKLRALADAESDADVVPQRSLMGYGKEVRERYEASKSGAAGIAMPWPAITKMAGGLQRRSVTTILGRPGGGKTTMAINVARHAWVSGARVLFLSPEMCADEIAEVFYVIHSKTPYGGVILGNLDPESEGRLYQTIDEFGGETGLDILDSGDRLTPARVSQAIRKFRPDLVVADSLYEFFKSEYGDELKRLDFVTSFFQGASQLLRDDTGGVAMLGTSQLKKGSGDGEEAGLDDAGMSDKIAQRSQNVFKMWMKRPEDENNHVRRVSPLKVRRRAHWQPVVMLNWDWKNIRFEEIAPKTKDYQDSGVT